MFEIDSKKQRQRRRDGARSTESKSTRGKQILLMSTKPLTNREWLPGEVKMFEGLAVFFRYEIMLSGLPKLLTESTECMYIVMPNKMP